MSKILYLFVFSTTQLLNFFHSLDYSRHHFLPFICGIVRTESVIFVETLEISKKESKKLCSLRSKFETSYSNWNSLVGRYLDNTAEVKVVRTPP
jgi:hypothetical protein